MTNFTWYTYYCEFLLHHVEHMGMFLNPFSCKHLYIKSQQVGETNKRTVVVVVARVYRQNSSRSISKSCNWKDCTQEVEKIPVKEIMMMKEVVGSWLKKLRKFLQKSWWWWWKVCSCLKRNRAAVNDFCLEKLLAACTNLHDSSSSNSNVILATNCAKP